MIENNSNHWKIYLTSASSLILALTTLLFFSACGGKKKVQFSTIGTGGVTGVYYQVGSAVSKIINKKFDEYGLKVTFESTAGSVYNINAVLNGDLDFGVAQSDRQYQAYFGKAPWDKDGPRKELRSVFSIHPETITLVASEPSNIKSINDLKGKKVNLGGIGSGTLKNSQDVLRAVGINESEITVENVKPVESPGLLQDERIDAFFYTVGHPNGNIKEATSGRIKVALVPIKGEKIDKLLAKTPYYAKSTIPKEFYPNSVNQGDVDSLGVKATMVTSSKVPENTVYAITKELFENFDEFKLLHPAFKVLKKEDLLKGLSAPLHKGAVKYYRESGLIKHVDPKLIKED